MATVLPPGWKFIAKMVRQRDGGRCRLCGKKGNNVHHIIPLSCGSSNHPSNLQVLCLSCHAGKHPHLRRRLDSGKWKAKQKKLQGRR